MRLFIIKNYQQKQLKISPCLPIADYKYLKSTVQKIKPKPNQIGDNDMKKSTCITFVSIWILILMVAPGMAFGMEVGLGWAGKSGMAKRVTKGFQAGIKELAPDINVEYQKELPAMDDLALVAARWQGEKQAMVLLRSNAAKWLGKNQPTIPTFIGGCNHPVQLGAVKNLESPGGNITGVTYFLPVATQFEIFKAILPNLNSVMLLIEKGHPSADIDLAGTKKVCAAENIDLKYQLCETEADVFSAVSNAKGNVSAIIIGNQSLMIDAAQSIVEAAGSTPVLSYSSKPVKVGALGGFVADDEKLGYMLAQSLVDVLKNGKTVGSIPIKIDPSPRFFINASTSQKLGIDIPFDILEAATVIE
jgi:putative tryptophan/tyrosine transport system substrate-binding protein